MNHKIMLPFFNELNILRLNRHEIFYSFEKESPDKNEVKGAINISEYFLQVADQLIIKKQSTRY